MIAIKLPRNYAKQTGKLIAKQGLLSK